MSAMRHDDFVHYCTEPRDKAIDRMMIANQIRFNPNLQAEQDALFKAFGGKCSAKHGWDDFEAPDSSQQWLRVMQVKIVYMWFGDKAWLERRFSLWNSRGY